MSDRDPADHALIAAIKAGDLKAFEAFYRRYESVVYRTARSLTRDEMAAEDVVVETFLRAHAARDRLDPERPRHPYTVALLSAVPDVDPDARRRRIVLKGDVPSPVNPPTGCRFHSRCWLRERLGNPEICATRDPRLAEVTPGHGAACHFADRPPAEAVRLEEVPVAV